MARSTRRYSVNRRGKVHASKTGQYTRIKRNKKGQFTRKNRK
jgi:hypothetical protein